MQKDRLKKIAVLHRYPPSQVIGTNASFVSFLNSLSSRGYKTYYVTYKDSGVKPQIENLEYVYLPFSFNRGNNMDKVVKTYLWIGIAPLYVLALQLKHHLDLVYCDDSVPLYGFLSKLISPRSKVVIRLGDLQTGYSLADKHKTLFSIALKFETLMWESVDGVVAISNAFKDFILAQGLANSKISVVEESINLDEAYQSSNSASTDTFTVLFHGALVSCKGIDVLLNAFSEFQKGKSNVRLIIAGGGPEVAKLKEQCQILNLDNVLFTGWYNHEKLNDLMKSVDISVVMRSPNLANNFVVTTCLLENWAYRKPVIAPDLAAFRGVVQDKINGILFKTGDAHDLAQKIDYLYIHRDIYPNLISNGLTTAREVFDHKKIANKMVSVLEAYI